MFFIDQNSAHSHDMFFLKLLTFFWLTLLFSSAQITQVKVKLFSTKLVVTPKQTFSFAFDIDVEKTWVFNEKLKLVLTL